MRRQRFWCLFDAYLFWPLLVAVGTLAESGLFTRMAFELFRPDFGPLLVFWMSAVLVSVGLALVNGPSPRMRERQRAARARLAELRR